MIRALALCLAAVVFLSLASPARLKYASASTAPVAISPKLPDCPTDTSANKPSAGIQAASPRELSLQGGFHGTITIHPGLPHTCVVPLPGGAVLRADGNTAPPPDGRAVFRVVGLGLDTPGSVSIIATASLTSTTSVPETLPALNADAVVSLPPGTVLTRYDPGTDRFVVVPNAHIRLAALYRILRKGTSPLPQPAAPPLPATLPATGGSPARSLPPLAIALLFLGSVLARTRSGARRPRRRRTLALAAAGILLVAAVAAVYLYTRLQVAPPGFGSLDGVTGPLPRSAGASSPPARLVIARLGIDTPVISLHVVGGAWQLPAYSAGYLTGTAWPGRGGNEAIAGHDDRDGAVFRRLDELRSGDIVQVYAGGHVYRYGVVALRVVSPTRVDVLRPTGGATLTLITCAPYLVDTERLVARARLLQ